MVSVDFGEKTGKTLKPVNGINNGPLFASGRVDLSHYYTELGIPYIRLHDTEYSFGTPYFVDISKIFTVFDADEADPKNYHFYHTDQLLDAIHTTGAKTIYRLGESIDHSNYKRHARAPKDFNKWAKICLNIVRHYNEGWADGFRLGIEYWEIWNEPDGLIPDRAADAMWSESDPYAYYDLYSTAAKLLKKECPSIRIGGYAACGFTEPNRYEYLTRFLDTVKAENAPLDFLSWHTYTGYHDTESVKRNAVIARDELDKRGFKTALSILDEWNIAGNEEGKFADIFASDIEGCRINRDTFENQKNMVGASMVAAHFIMMNDLPIDIAAYYNGDPAMGIYCGLWDRYMIPQKTFYAFKAYGELYKNDRERVLVQCDNEHIFCIANKTTALIASYGGGGDIEVILKNPPVHCTKAEIYMLDDNFYLELFKTETLKKTETGIRLWLGEHAVVFIKLAEEGPV